MSTATMEAGAAAIDQRETCRNVAPVRTSFECSACGYSGAITDLVAIAPLTLTCPSCGRILELLKLRRSC